MLEGQGVWESLLGLGEMSEHQIQSGFTEWLNWQANQYRALATAYAIPNGGLRSKAQAGKLKAEGVRAGIPDYCFPFARQGFNALYIEFKDGNKPLSASQKAMVPLLRANGNRVDVAGSVEQAIAIVEDYMGMVNQMESA